MQGVCDSRGIRGGYWTGNSTMLRSSNRGGLSTDMKPYDVGFRVARTLNVPVVTPQTAHPAIAKEKMASLAVPKAIKKIQTKLGEFGDWEAYRDTDGSNLTCYIGAQPVKVMNNRIKRGKIFVLITHRPAENSFGVISFRAGYTFMKRSEAHVTIGNESFRLFTDTGHAFAYDDTPLINAMIRGTSMIIQGTSSNGSQTTDTYSLKGVSSAWRSINKACR